MTRRVFDDKLLALIADNSLGVLATLASLARVPLTVTEGPTRAAGALGRSLYGSAARFEAVSGWRPEIPFERTLADLLDEWRARIASESA